MPEINMDEYLAEISRYVNTDVSGAMTTEEIGAAMGWGICKAHRRVKEYVRSGQLEVIKVPRTTRTGIVTKVFAYRPRIGEKGHSDDREDLQNRLCDR